MGFWRPLLVLAQEPQGGYKAGLHLPCPWPDGVSSQKFCLSCILPQFTYGEVKGLRSSSRIFGPTSTSDDINHHRRSWSPCWVGG